MSTKSLHGVWRPGKGAQRWRTGLSFEQLKAEDEAQVAKGRRMIDLTEERGDGYTALWRESSAATRWVAGLGSARDFGAHLDEQHDLGFRITRISRRSRYCAIWRKGSGEQFWDTGLSLAEFEELDADRFRDGFRLAGVDTYRKGSGHRYFAVWRPGKGAQWWHAGDGIAGADQAYFNLGFRIALRDHGGVGHGLFVWTRGSGPQLWATRTVPAFRTFDRQQFDKGLRLTHLKVGFGF